MRASTACGRIPTLFLFSCHLGLFDIARKPSLIQKQSFHDSRHDELVRAGCPQDTPHLQPQLPALRIRFRRRLRPDGRQVEGLRGEEGPLPPPVPHRSRRPRPRGTRRPERHHPPPRRPLLETVFPAQRVAVFPCRHKDSILCRQLEEHRGHPCRRHGCRRKRSVPTCNSRSCKTFCR